jgi:surface polysaccharide O-acyltransferase-like enzyme
MIENRNYTIDALRTAGAFSVIILHAPLNDFFVQKHVNAIALCARWAVPFFFLVSGYFFEKKSKLNLDVEFAKSLKHLISIFLIANIIYSIVALQTSYYSIKDVLSIKSILLGNWFHLWFIGSMILGYITLWFVLSIRQAKAMPYISLAIIALALTIGPYTAFTNLNVELFFSRYIVSIPFLFIGFLFSRHYLNKILLLRHSIIIILLGVIGVFIENSIIYNHTKPISINHEYLFSTFLLSIGLFILSFNIKISKENFLAEIGRDYSLLIYLYHPLVILITFSLIKKFRATNSFYIWWFNPISIFIITLLIIIFIRRMYPKTFKLISGRI